MESARVVVPPELPEPAHDYTRVATMIAWLRQHAAQRPSLADLARQAGVSEFHVQRLFTRWAGVSPKRFLQTLALEDIRRRLADSRNVLELADDAGLSGAGRLHDLVVTLEAVSPGELRSGGAGVEMAYGFHDTPFGQCLLAQTARGVCALRFGDGREEQVGALGADWPGAGLVRDDGATAGTAARIFGPLQRGRRAPLALLVRGTNFQIQVWRALLRIPFGALTTYGAVAQAIGHPRAARAVGSAVGANPVAWLIPCHRVLRESGALGGYRWGETRKAALLGWEAAHMGEAGVRSR
ncbi:MAG: methylated-DNA--[protein]-cysteine S-methyltransferase [Betaproteobacteria bacterium]|nr:methylated-DNA--[protein]-cysteine S-methyltransferase [Betaproteobacteria bacterium]